METLPVAQDALVGLAVRSLLLLIATALVAITCRRCSAALQHGIWTVGLGGCLVLPMFTWLSPGWSVPVLPAKPPEVLTSSRPKAMAVVAEKNLRSASRQVAPAAGNVKLPQEATNADKPTAEFQPPATVAEVLPVTQPSSSSPVRQAPGPGFAPILYAVWLTGVLVVTSRLAYRTFTMQRCVGRSRDVTGADWHELRSAAAQLLGVPASIPVRVLDGVASPLVTGQWRPAVLLPLDADAWSLERRRLVLLHEFAHVRRRDLWTQTMANLACAFYWFLPLAWWGERQMSRLREIACDDVVVTRCGVPAAYAQTLLEIAQRCQRRRRVSGAIAMAASSQVEGRIAAILNASRNRASLTTRSACVLGACALATATAVGTCHLSSRAAQASPDKADQPAVGETMGSTTSQGAEPQSQADIQTGPRTMTVRSLDEAGMPVPNVILHVNSWYTEGEENFAPFIHVTTDQDGQATIDVHRGFRNVRLWTSKPGYVPLFIEFADGEHVKGRPLPDEWEFRMPTGQQLGGRVVDEQGVPVTNAQVQVRVDTKDGKKPSLPLLSTSLTDTDFGYPAPMTDAEGRWSIEDAPASPEDADDYDFLLKVTHPDFAGDTKWGELQQHQPVTTDELRRGAAVLVLNRGTVITGNVTGPDGKPVTRGWFVWNDEPYFNSGDWEATIDERGHFQIPPLTPGEYPITIIALGYAAERRIVSVRPGIEPLQFELKPGNRIVFHIVDGEGTPIPNAGVYLGAVSGANTWNNTNALHNQPGSNVPDYGIPRAADTHGVYVWDWAPDGAVTYYVRAKGFATRELALVPKKYPHVITLAPQRFAVGTVTDASTGKRIENFQAMPVIVFRPDFYSTRTIDAVNGHDGQYELPLTGGATDVRYRVRFEADGYRAALSDESFGPLDGKATLDFALHPAAARRGRVVDDDGRPVTTAIVLEASPTIVPSTTNGQPDSYGSRPVETDAEGNFQLHATTEPALVRVYDERGFAEQAVAPEAPEIGVIALRPWAQVTGRLLQDGRPMGDQIVYFSPLTNHRLTEARFQDSYYSRTDSNGNFQFDRLPPISGSLQAHLGPWSESPLTSSEAVPLNLAPGEQRHVTLGGDGATVAGRVVATDRNNESLSKQWSLNYLISRDDGVNAPPAVVPLSFDPVGPVQPDWLRQPDFPSWVTSRLNFFVKLSGDGRLMIHGVPAGEYDLVVQLYEEPAGCLVETIGEKVVPVTVTQAEADNGAIEIGDIEVECRTGPRAGSDMRAFKFTDAHGQVRHVDDLAGKFVLLHAWATWCRPCLESMPAIKSTVMRYSDAPLTVVGLNVDDDPAVARAMAQAEGWDWAQNYLGNDSAMMRQLAVSTIPAYYLIGPDGKLVGSSNHWEQIQQLLRTELDNFVAISP